MASYGDTLIGQGRSRRHLPSVEPLPCLRAIGLFVLLLAVAWSSTAAPATGAVDIEAAVGFTDTFRPGHWTPLSVTVTNRGGDLNGELEVQVTGDDALQGRLLTTSHRRKLELHRGSRKSLQFTVHPQGLSHPLVIRVRSGAQEIARAEIDLRTRFTAQRLLLVLSRNADLDYLNDGSVDGVRVLYPHPELLPAHWRGYDAVAAIVLHGVSLERLSTSQFEALHKWIAQGGILAVSGGADYALLRSSRLATLLPALPVGMRLVDAGAMQRAFSASLDVSRPIHVNRLGELRGHVRLRTQEEPLIVERTLGLGRVLYLTFDVAGYPFDRWEGMRALWLDTLRLPPTTTTSLAGPEPSRDTALAALIRAQGATFPAYSSVFLFLTLYLGVLLAGYGLPLRGKRHRWLTPLGSWAAPLLFAPLAWLLFGPAAFPRGSTAATVALIEPLPGSHYARLGLELGLYANRSGAQRFEYRGGEPVLYPHRQAQREGKVGDWVFGEGSRPFVQPLDRRRYVLHALEGEDLIAFHLDVSVQAEATGPRLLLDNASGRNLQGLWLVFDSHVYALGPVAAGARFERRLDSRAHGIAVGEESWRRVLKPASGLPPSVAAPAQILLERKAQALGASGFPGPGHALLIGYTSSPLEPAGTSSDWTRQEGALMAMRVAARVDQPAAAETGMQSPRPRDGAQEDGQSLRMPDAAVSAAPARQDE